MKRFVIVGGIMAVLATGCAQNPAKPQAVQQSFPAGSVVQVIQSGPLGSTLSGEDLTVIEKGLTTVHPRKPILDQWTSVSGHRIRIDHTNFGKKQNGFFCMEAKVLVDEKEALPSSSLCRRGSWMIVHPSELAAVHEKLPVLEMENKSVASKKTRPAAKNVLEREEKSYTIN